MRGDGPGYNAAVPKLPTLSGTAAFVVTVYLCAAGWFFILAPWSDFWQNIVVSEAPLWLFGIVQSPGVRGALAAFGVLHFPVAAAWLASTGRRP